MVCFLLWSPIFEPQFPPPPLLISTVKRQVITVASFLRSALLWLRHFKCFSVFALQFDEEGAVGGQADHKRQRKESTRSRQNSESESGRKRQSSQSEGGKRYSHADSGRTRMSSQSDGAKARHESGKRSRNNSQTQSASGTKSRRDSQRNRKDSGSDHSARKEKSPLKHTHQDQVESRNGPPAEKSQPSKTSGNRPTAQIPVEKISQESSQKTQTKERKGDRGVTSSGPGDRSLKDPSISAEKTVGDKNLKLQDSKGSKTSSNSSDIQASKSDKTVLKK